MDAQSISGVRDSLFIAREGRLNVELLKFCERFIKHNVAVQHFVDERF